MTDRELLEKAARAAGLDALWLDAPNGMSGKAGMHAKGGQWHDTYWNPLTDEGDALRLAVRIVMLTSFFKFFRLLIERLRQEHGDPGDPYSATRRAIVRAAAALDRP